MDKRFSISEEDWRRAMAQAEQAGAELYARRRAEAESQMLEADAIREAMAMGQWTLPTSEVESLLAQGRHHKFCAHPAFCSCGVERLGNQRRDEADALDQLAGYGLV